MTGLSLKGLWQRIGDKEREIVARFVEQELDWQNIKNKASNFIFCLSRDDHAVDFEESFKYYKELFPDADFKIYENYGHFNHKKNIYEMPDILSII
jgi:predicted alpha/beta hydrolase family esterase